MFYVSTIYFLLQKLLNYLVYKIKLVLLKFSKKNSKWLNSKQLLINSH